MRLPVAVCKDAMFVRTVVCMVTCARNPACVCGFAEAAACGEVDLVSPVLPLAALRAYMTFPFPYAPTDTPARFRTAKPLSTSRGTRRSRQHCASTETSIHRSSLGSWPFPTVLLLLSRFSLL